MNFAPHGIAKGWRSFERKKIVHPLFKISVWASSAQKEPIEKNFLKIIDFGLSCKYTNGQVLQTKANFSEKRVARSIISCMCHHDMMFYQFCLGPFLTTGLCRTSWSLLALLISILKFDALKAGTPYYVAPQVLQGKYDQVGNRDWTLLPSIHLTPPEAQAADLWSCGVLFCMFTLVSPCQAKLFWIFENAHHRTDLLVCKGKETLAQDSRTKRYWDTSRFCIETQDDTRTYKNTSNKWCAMCTTCRDHGPIIAMMRVLKSSLVLRSQKHPADFQKTFRQVIMFVLLCGYPPFFGDSDAEVLAKALGIQCQTHTWAVSKSRSIDTPECRGLHPVRKESSLEISKLDGIYLSWQLLIDPQHFPAEHWTNRIILLTIVLVCFSMF